MNKIVKEKHGHEIFCHKQRSLTSTMTKKTGTEALTPSFITSSARNTRDMTMSLYQQHITPWWKGFHCYPHQVDHTHDVYRSRFQSEPKVRQGPVNMDGNRKRL